MHDILSPFTGAGGHMHESLMVSYIVIVVDVTVNAGVFVAAVVILMTVWESSLCPPMKELADLSTKH
jgi:hypothetical protein